MITMMERRLPMSRCFRGLQCLQLIWITPLGRSARAKPREISVTETSNLGCTLVDWTHDCKCCKRRQLVSPEFVRPDFGNVRERQQCSHLRHPCACTTLRVTSPCLPPLGPYNTLHHTHDVAFPLISFARHRGSPVPVS